ncbi:MAG: RNA polymerase sigma factor [Clostridia bacterium]|nr:RNA polymerase sigma factor [Clostridia bacterium]
MEDYQIVDLYWDRSERAISETDTKYGRMLTGISLGLVKIKEDAEECLSDTYLAAWNSMPDERPIYLGAFLSKIIRRISIDKYRAAHSEKRGGKDALVAELTECIPSATDVQKEYDNKLLAEALNRFLYSLDEEKRNIFVRRYFYSDAIDDIANRMNVSVGKVKTVLFRTRNALREFLLEEGVEL